MNNFMVNCARVLYPFYRKLKSFVVRMAPKKKRRTEEYVQENGSGMGRTEHKLHLFSRKETEEFQRELLQWFALNKRDLPWRVLATQGSIDEKVYAVLVSEIMLQQTQVVTVKDYYRKWMARWPTFKHLAEASLEEVHEMWSGLGYYARGRRLHEAAKKVCTELSSLPTTASELQEKLPGVGRYTAAAVASIVFGEKVAAVDGNVVRVLARQRAIGGDSSSVNTLNELWSIADRLVDPEHPGVFNEAIMELGATVCTPKGPKCSSCPVKNTCLALKYMKYQGLGEFSSEVESVVQDIETVPNCRLCVPPGERLDPSLGVMNFPRKVKKALPKKQRTVVWILHRDGEEVEEYFLVKRPSKGLLADLWEFPGFLLESGNEEEEKYAKECLEKYHGVRGKDIESSGEVGEVVHIFSHIHQVYVVYKAKLKSNVEPWTSDQYRAQQWMNDKEIKDSAISTAMKKVFSKLNIDQQTKTKDTAVKKKRSEQVVSKNAKITEFFKKDHK